MSEVALRITVARQLAALRRQGWSAADAVAFVAPALDPGPLREACTRAGDRLRTGQGPGGEDLLEALISRGDAASPAALDALADSYRAGEAARRSLRYARTLLGVCLIGPMLIGCVLEWMGFSSLVSNFFRGPLPIGSRVVMAALAFLKWGGPPLAVVTWFALRAGLQQVSSRGREAMTAGALLQLSSALASGQSEAEALQLLAPRALSRNFEAVLHLSRAEARFLEWARSSVGLSAGARALAAEKLREGAARQARFERLAPVVAVVVVVAVVSAAWVSLMIPIFNIARGSN